jgi:hypothetical protein
MRLSLLIMFCAILSEPAFALVIGKSQFVEASWKGNNGPIDPLRLRDAATGNEQAGTNLTSGTCYAPSCTIASGFQAADGSSYAGLEVYWADGEAPYGSASMETRQRLSVFNDGSATRRLSFDYLLKDMSIDLFAGSGGPSRDSNPFRGSSDAVGVQIGYQVSVDGALVSRQSFTLWGGSNPAEQNVWFDWESEGGLAPLMLTPTDCIFGQCGGRNASFGPLTRSLELGALAAGDTMEIETRMWAAASGNSFEWDAQARIGDPNGLTGTQLAATAMQPVPLPGSLALLIAGVGLLAGLRARRSGADPAARA